MIDNLKPEIIIADGSNYPSFVARWKATSEAKNTAFHSTSTDGSYPLNWFLNALMYAVKSSAFLNSK